MDKQHELVRDLAKLFVKYDMNDWRVVIDILRKGGPEYETLIRAIEELSTKRGAARKAAQRPRTDRLLEELAESNPRRAELLKGLMEKLESKALAPRLADLRELCLGLGIKETLPKRREDAIAFVLKQFAEMPDDALYRALEQIPARDRDLQDEYNRWFRMICVS